MLIHCPKNHFHNKMWKHAHFISTTTSTQLAIITGFLISCLNYILLITEYYDSHLLIITNYMSRH